MVPCSWKQIKYVLYSLVTKWGLRGNCVLKHSYMATQSSPHSSWVSVSPLLLPPWAVAESCCSPCQCYIFSLYNMCHMLHFHWTSDHHHFFLSYLPLSRSTSPYHTQITSDCLVPFSYPQSTITPISDRPLSYPVALCLSPYQWLFPYLPVQYIGSQSGGTVGLGLRPLCLVTLLAWVSQQYIRCTARLLGP